LPNPILTGRFLGAGETGSQISLIPTLIGRFWRLERLGPQISLFSGLQLIPQRTQGGWLVVILLSATYNELQI
jgi:hypothetical protein